MCFNVNESFLVNSFLIGGRMRVLIIEDDIPTSKFIEQTLHAEGFICEVVDSGKEGLELLRIYDYSAIVLDLMLPDYDGCQLLQKVRRAKIDTPVIVLSGLSDSEDKVKALSLGADDYITKPFNQPELIARIQAVVRRSKGHAHSVIKIGQLELNLNSKIASVKGNQLELTGKEYAILELMAIRKGAALSKEAFLNHLYAGEEEPEIKVIDVFICKLRKKLAKELGGENYIKTLWGRGYMLEEPQYNVHISNNIGNSTGQSVGK